MELFFTKEELDIIYLQLSARRIDFEDQAVKAAQEKNFQGVKVCIDYADKIQTIINKALEMKNRKLDGFDSFIDPESCNSSSSVQRNF